MEKVFITGVTGFLGSNIAEYLIEKDHEVIATFRADSSRTRCLNYHNKVKWILQTETNDWANEVVKASPEIVIHAAWVGVTHKERDDWECQLLNIDFTKNILDIARKSNSRKVICLGSQAEYGAINGCVAEDFPLNPVEAYGYVKIICSELTKQYCNYHNIEWYWLRLFSFFGQGESERWLIPSLIKEILINDHLDLTPGEQKYAYLYVKDLALGINNIIGIDGKPGIYNISAKKAIKLKDLVEKIRDKINTSFTLNFGKLPYRKNQSMHIQGDSSKFVNEFGEFDVSDFDNSISQTIEYFKRN